MTKLLPFEDLGAAYELTFQSHLHRTPLRLDFQAARRLLAARMRDANGMRALRMLLWPRSPGSAVSRMTDVEVVERLATHVATRRLFVYSKAIRRTVSGAPQKEEVIDEALGPLPVAEREEPAGDSVDVAPQVAVMLAAARTGAPFCEECEKARLAAAAKAAVPATPDPYANADVVAQAAVMRDAAADGAPFCEECEKARLAAAKAATPAPAQDPYANTDVPAQAALMQKAAVEGAPFCEECERARKAQGATPG